MNKKQVIDWEGYVKYNNSRNYVLAGYTFSKDTYMGTPVVNIVHYSVFDEDGHRDTFLESLVNFKQLVEQIIDMEDEQYD